MMTGIFVLVLTGVLMYLYHKCFTVVYVDALAGIVREIAVCFVLSVVIVGIIGSVLGLDFDSKESKGDKSSSQELLVKDFYGNFYNTALLHNGVFDTFLMIGDSEESRGDLHIFGHASAITANYFQSFDIDIPMPTGNTFTCQSEVYQIALTITLHPEDHTLEIVQEPITSNGLTPFTGSYVDADTWKGLEDQRRAAIERAETLARPNLWIRDYRGSYILETFVEGEEGAPNTLFAINYYEDNSTTFRFSTGVWVGGDTVIINDWYDWTYYSIPYPLGNNESKHIEYETDDGLIAFDVLDDKADGRHVIRVTACPNLKCTGVFVSDAEYLDSELLMYSKRLTWPGNYVCESGGEDGTKSISISQINDQLLSIEMVHNYADGRVETYHAEAELNTYGNRAYYAVSSGEKWIDFKLQENPDTGEKMVRVEQTGINLSKDPEFWGTYFVES